MSESASVAYSTPLTRRDHKTLWLATLGGVLEFYDFVIFVFFANTIGTLFFPPGVPDWVSQFQTFAIFAIGYFVRPLGGVLMAHAGDLHGRKRMFTFSIFLMGLSTLGIGLLPTYSTLGAFAPICLLLLRVGQGAAVGGEVPGGWVFVSEHVHRSRVGFACGLLTAGLTTGILLGSLVATGLNQVMPPEHLTRYGWRIAFVLGGVFGLISVYLRRLLSETPVFEEMKARQALSAELPLKTVVRDYRQPVILSVLLTWFLSAAIVVTILMTPALLEKSYHVPRLESLQANCVATLTLGLGCIVTGFLTDRFGPARVLLVGCPLLGIAAYWLYAGVLANLSLLLPLYAIAGFTVGIVAVVPYIMIEAFPPRIRFTGVSFAYNIGYAFFGGLTPLLIASLIAFDALAPAHYIDAVCLLGFSIGIILLLTARRTT